MAGGRPYCIQTKEQADRALTSFAEHIASGQPQFSWFLDEPLVRCCDQTLLDTMKSRPELFDSVLKDKAHSAAYKIWWEKGQNMVEGKVKGSYSPQIYNIMMRNLFSRFGWWKEEEKEKNTSSDEALAALKSLASAMVQSNTSTKNE